MSFLASLRKTLNASLDALEEERIAAGLPEFTLDPSVVQPFDDANYLPSPKLFEAQRVARASLGVLSTLITPAFVQACDGPYMAGLATAWGVAAEHNIAGLLAEKGVDPKVGLDVNVLAQKTGADAHKLARCLRVLTRESVFTETSEDVFANNRISLSIKGPSESHSWCVLAGKYLSKGQVFVSEQIMDKSGAFGFQLAYQDKRNFWDWLYADPLKAKHFIAGMGGIGQLTVAGCVADYPYAQLGNAHLVDVGGGQGALSLPIIATHKNLRLTIQDLENVVPAAKANLSTNFKSIEASRVSFQAIDFFKKNPIGGSDAVYMARWILHDWPDKEALQILKGIRAAMDSKARILIFDYSIIPSTPSKSDASTYFKNLAVQPSQTQLKADQAQTYSPLELPEPLPQNGGAAVRGHGLMDITMAGFFDSTERTLAHLKRLADEADLEVVKLYATRGLMSIAEMRVKGFKE